MQFAAIGEKGKIVIPRAMRDIFTGLTLKVFAVITMLIDHIGVGIISYVMLKDNYALFYSDPAKYEKLNHLYLVCRAVGRSAFPIFCFLLAEGFCHTKSRIRYVLNLVVFGLISELPFDLALITLNRIKTFNLKQVIADNINRYWLNQNVFLTLALGLITIWILDTLLRKRTWFFYCCSIAVVLLAGCMAQFALKSDYGVCGILLIVIFYLLREKRGMACIVGYAFLTIIFNFVLKEMEIWSLPAFILIYLYNGKRGNQGLRTKYMFYAFYPLHLLVIFIIRVLVVSA